MGLLRTTGLWLATSLTLASAVRAQEAAEFYRGKTIEIYIGYSAGGGYDVYARLLARHFGKHVPGNPSVVTKNMEGAGSVRLANWLATLAPRDGTVFGTIGRGAPFDKLLGRQGIQFDATRYGWIGSANNEVSACVTWHTSGITTFADLQQKPVIVGAAGAGSDDDQFPRVINGIFGTRMQVINGYPGGNDVTLALERGEVAGRCGWSWSSIKSSRPNWIAEKKLNVVLQLGLSKHDDLKGVPLVTDLAKTDQDKAVLQLIFARQVLGRPFMAPLEVPADRMALLRKAFSDTMADPEFLNEAEKAQLEVTPMGGQELGELVNRVYRDTSEATARTAALLVP